MFVKLFIITTSIIFAAAHIEDDQKPIAGPHKGLWYNALPGDGGTQAIYPESQNFARFG